MAKKIFIVDDSALMRRIACDIIASDDRFEVADMAKNGLEALDLLQTKEYDAVILDVNMPRMNGLELLRELQKRNIHARVLMFSTQTGEGTRETLEALELGAVDFIQKPEGIIGTGDVKFRNRFLELLSVVARAYARPRYVGDNGSKRNVSTTSFINDTVNVTREHLSRTTNSLRNISRPTGGDVKLRPSVKVLGEKIVAIASSTGGPKALQHVIPKLPANLDAPVLLVQHMPAGFTKSLADRLDELSPIKVKEAEDGEKLEKGCVYVACGGRHMKVSKSANHYRIYYTDEASREGVRPCANYMYESLIDSDYAQICCVVLTGMGADGTVGIKNLEEKKKVHIISQDEETCAVYGMPKSIANTGLVNEVLPLDLVADSIVRNVGIK